MLKRRYADFDDWSLLIKKRVEIFRVEEEKFNGLFSVLYLDEVRSSVSTLINDISIKLVDTGYVWVQYLPINKNHCITTMFNTKYELIIWKVDITNHNGLGVNEKKDIPYFDDLFLDIFILPSYKPVLVDEDELKTALTNGIITELEYNIAYDEVDYFLKYIQKHYSYLNSLTLKCRQLIDIN